MPLLIRLITIITGGVVSYTNPLFEGWRGILLSTTFIILGLISLIWGGDMLVEGSGHVAKKFGIPPIVIGLTILAFGTSAPELFVNLIASARGESALLVSNIVGSNISNLLLIGGAAAIIALLPVNRNTLLKELPFSIGATLLLFILINTVWFGETRPGLGFADGIVLLGGFLLFIGYIVWLVKHKEIDIIDESPDNDNQDLKKSLLFIILGMYALYVGGDLIVKYASLLAEMFGVSKIMIGASIVAIGTSVPELVTSIISARKNQADMAIGNIIGSNIFNIFWIGGLCSVIRPVEVNTILNTDMIVLMLATLLILAFAFSNKQKSLHRRHGIILITLYVGYLGFLMRRG